METDFGSIEELNNFGALFGLDGDADAELAGFLGQIKNPVTRQRMLQKAVMPVMPSRGSRAEMEKQFASLPNHIKEGLRRGELRLADVMLYSIKPVAGSKTIKLFETQDDKEIGLRSISNAKLPKNQALLVSGIVLLAGSTDGDTKDKMMTTAFDKLEAIPALCTGEFNLKTNKRVIIPETSMRSFCTSNNHMVNLGYYKLSNPRLIIDDVQIEATIELGSTTGIPANTNIFIGLHGTITTP